MRHKFLAHSNKLLRIGLPIVFGQAAMIGMGITDVFMAGHASAEDLAGVTLGNTVTTFIFLIFGGVLYANGPIVGQLFGAGNYSALRNQFAQCFWLSLVMGILASLLLLAFIPFLGQLGASQEVVRVAKGYLLPMIGTTFAFHMVLWMRTTLEGSGLTRVVMIINATGFLINIPLDYALVYGKWGLPELGGIGCGWATFIIISLQIVIYLLYYSRGKALRNFQLFSQWSRPIWQEIKEILRIGLPISATILFEYGYFGVIPLIVASLGTEVISGHSIAAQIDTLMFILTYGVAQAITITVSHQIGGNNLRVAREISIVGMVLIGSFALLQVLVYVLGREILASWFSDDLGVQLIASELLLIAAVYRFMDALACGAQGALRGCKITRSPMIIQFISFWLIGFPIAYVLSMTDVWGEPMGVHGFWLGLVISLTISASLLTYKMAFHLRQVAAGQPS